MDLKIVSLVPSITFLLCELGLENKIVGRTKFCTEPKENVSGISIIGGTKNIDFQKIKSVQPTLVLATKEENIKEQVQALKKHYKTIVFDVNNLEDNYKMIEKIGKLTQTAEKATQIIQQTVQNFRALEAIKINPPIPTLYLIWKKPYMTIGKDTFIHAMMESMGLQNLFGHQTRYPIINNMQTSFFDKCKLVILSSEPYPFTEAHFREIREQLPNVQILLADGAYFSWYGSKIKEAPSYFQQLIEKINKS